jgi:uncharacterized protein YqjF (DUF2071 family)
MDNLKQKTFLTARWEDLVMANYSVPPEILIPYLPKGVELDLFEGQAFVSLVGFMFKRTRLFGIPIPLMGTFEEINLRFYVKRKIGDTYKRGVVFINETVPYKAVAFIANKLYKEHYISIPTKSQILQTESLKNISYQWKSKSGWNKIDITTDNTLALMPPDSIEEFIFEHYYGYTKVSETESQEYKVNHPRWNINKVLSFDIQCDFLSMYGEDFSFLSHKDPDSVIFAEGSAVSVDWKRTTLLH